MLSGQQAARTIAGVGSETYLLNILGAKKTGSKNGVEAVTWEAKKNKK